MMWELISSNRKKSMWLFVGMAILLVTLGFFVGHVWIGDEGGLIGIAVAIVIWGGMTLVSVTNGDRILLAVAGAKEVTPDVHPQLFNVVEEMKIAAQLPAMPKVYIMDSPALNAFAMGMKPEKAAVAVTAGLLSKLNRDELQGVMAHEVAHIVNRDSQLMTTAGIMLGSIVLISQVFLRSMWFMPGGASKRYRKNDSGGSPQLQMIMVVVAIALAILAPIFSRLLYLAISRKREYLADATAAQLTRYPEGLASALEKLGSSSIPLESANKVTAPMYIVNPLFKKGLKVSSLSSTHPPLQQRIDILRAMTQGADYYTYQKAFNQVRGKTNLVIPKSVRKKEAHVAIRDAHPDSAPVTEQSKKAAVREVGDLMRAVNGYAFLVCACGLKMKIPPDLDKPHVDCPRCGRENEIPAAEMAVVAEVVGAVTGVTEAGTEAESTIATAEGAGHELRYQRRSPGWESFACACGHHMQISPAFQASTKTCPQCRRITFIEPL